MTFVVGITGGIGSGKSAVTALLEKYGITIADADIAARIIVQPGQPALKAIAQHFGEQILTTDGTLDRAALRAQVFADDDARAWLEQLTHPLIGEEIRTQLQQSRSPYTVLSSPLLLETRQRDLVDYIVVVDVPPETQLARTVARDGNDEAQVKRIMAAQINRSNRLRQADVVLDNSGGLAELELAIEALHQNLLTRAAQFETATGIEPPQL